MREFTRRFYADQTGATAIEYGLIAALIALAVVGAFSAVASGIHGVFNVATNNLAAH